MTAEEIIANLESRGLGWDIGHTGRLRECRIWNWPHVVGRYRPHGPEPLAEQLSKAIADMEAGGQNANP